MMIFTGTRHATTAGAGIPGTILTTHGVGTAGTVLTTHGHGTVAGIPVFTIVGVLRLFAYPAVIT